jgi:glutaredoxin-like protein NrdH
VSTDREPREGDVVVWTKPSCQQCRMVKFRLQAADVPFVEQDLTAPANAKDLEHFRGLGYSSAPITEFEGIAVPGFMPSEIDRVIAAWRAAQPAEVNP